MNLTKLHGRVVRCIEIIMVADLAFIVANLGYNLLWYRLNSNFYDYLFEVLAYALVARGVLAVPWSLFVFAWGWKDRAIALAVTTLYAYLVFFIGVESFSLAVEHVVTKRTAHRGSTTEQSLSYFYDYDRWYPRASFIREVNERVPEDESILYFGDLRGHMFSYSLYPRRLHVHPEVQLLHDANEQCRWVVAGDPLQPHDARFEGEAVGLNKPEVRAELKAFIVDRGIEWAIYYDSLAPDETRLVRIGQDRGGQP